MGKGDYVYYKFGSDANGNNCGFYLNGTSGEPFELNSKECYFALPQNAVHAKAYIFNSSVTGIDKVMTDQQSLNGAVIYTPSGVRVHKNVDNLPKGLYIVNGKKMMVK